MRKTFFGERNREYYIFWILGFVFRSIPNIPNCFYFSTFLIFLTHESTTAEKSWLLFHIWGHQATGFSILRGAIWFRKKRIVKDLSKIDLKHRLPLRAASKLSTLSLAEGLVELEYEKEDCLECKIKYGKIHFLNLNGMNWCL